jgi:outer membrane protein insertion porin family
MARYCMNVTGWLIVAAALSAAARPVYGLQDNGLARYIGKRVVRVDMQIEGAESGETGEMRDVITVREGQPFSSIAVHDSLYRLYRAGLISGARVEGEAAGADGVTIRFIVRPQAHLDSVLFEGSPVFSPDELRAHLNSLDPGTKLLPGAVARGTTDLQSFYASRGYYQGQVTSSVRLDTSATHATVVYAINAGEPARVSIFKLVDAQGREIDLPAIKHSLVQGKAFSDQNLQQEIDSVKQSFLQKSYLAARISNQVTPNTANNTVEVTITVDQGPIVNVEVQGLELADKQKRLILPFYTQGGIDDFSIDEGARRLLDYAQKQGYFFAEITRPQVPRLDQSTVKLDYIVSAGSRYTLTRIYIHGETAVPKPDLLARLKSKTSGVISIGTPRRGITSNDLLRQDSNTIQKQLRDQGYRNAHVSALRGVSTTGHELIITFNVQQGPRTYVDEIGLRGNQVLTDAELRLKLKIKPGDPLLTDAVNRSGDQLASAYNTLGYANAAVSRELADLGSADDQDRVRLIYDITEGPRLRILHVVTHGNVHTDVGRLRRDFFLFQPGEWLNNDKILQTERVLYETSAFSSVDVHSEPVGRAPDGVLQRDLIVDLVEAKRYLLTYSLGFQQRGGNPKLPGLSVMHGVEGLVQLTNTNLFGKLDAGSILLKVAQDQLLGQISFTNPRPFGINYPASLTLFAQELADVSFSSDRYTAVLQVAKKLSDNTNVYLAYNYELVRVFNLKLSSIAEIQRNEQPVRLGLIGPGFLRDTRDNVFDATKGTLTSGNLQIASTALGGNNQYVQMLVQHSRYYRLPKFPKIVYSVSGKLGLAAPFGGQNIFLVNGQKLLPISQRFFAGGATDLRGFGFEQAGPRDQGTGNPTGGNALIVINNELRFPIWSLLSGAVFSDTGNVYPIVSDISIHRTSETLGFGLRAKTPVGPLRFDVGFLVVNPPPTPPNYRFYHFQFSFGQTF